MKTYKKQIRELALFLLDDSHGINQMSWSKLVEFLQESGNIDVLSKVQNVNGRFFLFEDDAETLEKL